jgi:hypothetical protein
VVVFAPVDTQVWVWLVVRVEDARRWWLVFDLVDTQVGELHLVDRDRLVLSVARRDRHHPRGAGRGPGERVRENQGVEKR